MQISDAFRAKCLRAISPVLVQSFLTYSTGSCFQSQGAFMYPPATFSADQVFTLANRTFGTTPNTSTRFGVHGVEAVYKACNTNNVAMNLRVYYCEPRHDIPYYCQNVPATPQINSLSALISQGWVDMVSVSNYGQDLSATLFQNQNFVSRFKVLSCKMLKMAAGETRTFTIKQPGTRYLNYSRWVNAGSPQILYAQGWTKMIIFQYWGMPVQLATNVSIVGTGAMQFEVINNLKYYVSASAPETAEIYNTQTCLDGTGNAFTLNGSGTMDVVVEQTGVNTIAF